ncbi:MAG: type IV pilus assembly protein PilM [Candidatus Magasanikbacteria bacterium]|nr:type IV pilus assembly protein PilM [Candidatus Magasanikbacteria bacterium]
MFLNPFHNSFGLDIGDRSIKLVQLQQMRDNFLKPHFKLAHHSQIPLPPGWIIDGELQKPEEIMKILKNHIAKQKDGLAVSPWVAISLPETKTYIQLIQLKTTEEEITEETIREVAPSYLPFDLDDIYLDWQVIGQEDNNVSVLLAAVPKRIADTYTYLLNIAGLTPLAMEVEATAITRAVINRQKDLSHEARGILDLGATRASFIIFDHGVIQFSLSLAFAGQEVTERISNAMNLELSEAEKMKKECGLDSKKCKGNLKSALEGSLNELADKITQAIQFYKLHFPEKNPLTGIRLCGGGANLPALENYLSAKLKLKVRKANPWVNLFPIGQPPIDEEHSLLYTTAVGLAMRAVETPINL